MAVWVAVLGPVYIVIYNALIWALTQRSWLWQRFFHPRRAPLVVVPLRQGVPKGTLPVSFWALDLLDPRGPTTSACFPRWVLVLWRLLVLPFYIGSFLQYHFTNDLGPFYVTYYTEWTFNFFFLTSMLGVANTIVDMRAFPATKGPTKNGTQGGASPAPARWTPLRVAHQICFEIVAPASIFIAAFYWGAIYKSGEGTNIPSQLFVHGLNNVFLLVDAFFSKIGFVSSHILAVTLYTTLYATFMWIYGGTTGNWPYSMLTFAPSAFGYYIALPILITVAFFLYLGFVALREWVLRRCGCSAPTEQHETSEVTVERDGAGSAAGKAPGAVEMAPIATQV